MSRADKERIRQLERDLKREQELRARYSAALLRAPGNEKNVKDAHRMIGLLLRKLGGAAKVHPIEMSAAPAAMIRTDSPEGGFTLTLERCP